MRLFMALAAAALVLAGCSSEAGTPEPVKKGCKLFDKQALAAALKTTEPIVERDGTRPESPSCGITVGATPVVAAMVFTAADSERFGYASWHRSSEKAGGVRDLPQAGGDKAFVAPTRPHESMGGVLHDGTFYRISVFAQDADPVTAATAFVTVLEAALA
ncbi:hypothetical protein [Labedaea rhizosphaerae]|uniref:DUF3558 domain-containing protein n=1 Tax=Labedaea rhizosphaerae TaxID=598644 RepID=A0A4R6SBQ6_LABRH|nr:hypothetical protein [Labedaea rhizosphaerae]TDP97479.1 hypothetical protein EV186_103443 [Labedaea rhizosphaerae]